MSSGAESGGRPGGERLSPCLWLWSVACARTAGYMPGRRFLPFAWQGVVSRRMAARDISERAGISLRKAQNEKKCAGFSTFFAKMLGYVGK